MKTREKTARLRIKQVDDLWPGFVAAQKKNVRGNWKARGVPWEVVGPRLYRERAARPLPDDGRTNPVEARGTMDGPTHQELWRVITDIWELRQAGIKQAADFWDGLAKIAPAALAGMPKAKRHPKVADRPTQPPAQ